jgi:hypothetical protein
VAHEKQYHHGLTEAWEAQLPAQMGMPEEALYQMLDEHGLVWDEEQGAWVKKPQPKAKPLDQIRITVRGPLAVVRTGADDVEKSCMVLGYERVRRIDLLPHPERTDEGQVSLTFRLPGKEQSDGN